MISGTKTIAQYKIITVTFTSDSSAIITDQKGDSMKVSYSPEEGIKEENN